MKKYLCANCKKIVSGTSVKCPYCKSIIDPIGREAEARIRQDHARALLGDDAIWEMMDNLSALGAKIYGGNNEQKI